MNDSTVLSPAVIEERSFISQVYGWMTLGLAMTGLVSLYMAAHTGLIVELSASKILLFGMMGIELVLVFALAGWAQKMSASEAAAAFLGYAGLTGVTISTIFLVYTRASIASTFFLTAATFGVMSLYGYTTKTDLTTIGNICFMGLIGVILASLVNFFFKSSAVYWVTTYIGILVFVGLTAYDTQKIKEMNVFDDPEAEKKEAIVGALTLYLDFINLFLELLQLFGKRED